jgi:hypothetical protein
VPSDNFLPIGEDQFPLVARTNLRDVRLVSIDAHAPDIPVADAEVRVTMEDIAYRAEPGALLVRLSAKVSYYDRKTDQVLDGTNPEDPAALQGEVGRITVTQLAELSFEGDSASITAEQADEFLRGNLLFMMFPYVRASIQQLASDLRLPPTVLPFLRRDVVSVLPDVDQDLADE